MATQNYNYLIIGSVEAGYSLEGLHDRMRKEDLIPCFLDVLEELIKDGEGEEALQDSLVEQIRDRVDFSEDDDNSYNYYESEEANYDLEGLFDALQEFAPPYFYFGSHPGNGDYGFWLCEDVAQDVVDSGGYATDDLEKTTEELKDIQSGGIVEILYVNDHGNTTLYNYDIARDELSEVWAIV